VSKLHVKIEKFNTLRKQVVVILLAELRVYFGSLFNIDQKLDISSATSELEQYFTDKRFHIWVAKLPELEQEEGIIGFMVIKNEDEVSWLELMYVRPEFRRKGIGKAMVRKAEEIVKSSGQKTLYLWIHPQNDNVIHFLDKCGYNTINMVELCKDFDGNGQNEQNKTLTINSHKFLWRKKK